MGSIFERGAFRWPFAAFASIAAAVFAVLLCLAPRSQAAEVVFWDNYSGDPDTIAFAGIDGSGGGVLNLSGAPELESPEGMAYDSVTNRLFVANSGGDSNGQITAINLDGSGAAVFTAPGAPIEEPEGVVVDPVTRMIYWVNTDAAPDGSIGWARLDGSSGGALNTTGATLDGPYKISLDPVAGKVYWANSDPSPEVISYANANNSGGGGDLNLAGAPAPEGITGLSVDPAGNRIYWSENGPGEDKVSFAALSGGNGGGINLTGAALDEPYGLAFDPSLGRLYWGNYGNDTTAAGAIGFANLSGGGGGINVLTAPVDGPQDPVILKSPSGTEAPTVTRSTKSRSSLSCSTGGWGADYAGSFVYQAPRSFAYQWTRNGTAIAGATATTLAAKSAGSYACVVTATNQTGTAGQTSAAVKVKAAKVKLNVKKKVTVKAGGVAKFNVKAVNQGDIQSGKARVCVKVPKKAKADLKAPKCRSLGKLKGRGKKGGPLKIKVGESAGGTYKVTFTVQGSPGKPAKAKVIVK